MPLVNLSRPEIEWLASGIYDGYRYATGACGTSKSAEYKRRIRCLRLLTKLSEHSPTVAERITKIDQELDALGIDRPGRDSHDEWRELNDTAG